MPDKINCLAEEQGRNQEKKGQRRHDKNQGFNRPAAAPQ
jgi:hypothetical protein